MERGEVAQLVHLPRDGLDDLRVIVTHGHATEPGEPVKDLPALEIPDHHPLALHDDPRRMMGFEVPGVGQRVNLMGLVQINQ